MARLDQEDKLEAIFNALEAAFKKVEKTRDDAKRQAMLKDITAQLRDAKTLIKDFEREARIDGMSPRELADRKRLMVNELNSYIALKKNYASADEARGELMAGAAPASGGEAGGAAAGGNPYEGVSMQELIKEGRRGMQETEQTLGRAERVVEDTLQIGQQTAATLHDQTQQLNKIVDDLNEIEFTMKKATRVIADITKGIMTDKCIMFLLFLVVAGVIALVVVKVVNPNKKYIAQAAANVGINTTQISNTISTGIQQASNQVTAGLSRSISALKGAFGGGGHGSGGGSGVNATNSSSTAANSTRRRLHEQMLYGDAVSGSSGTPGVPYALLW